MWLVRYHLIKLKNIEFGLARNEKGEYEISTYEVEAEKIVN